MAPAFRTFVEPARLRPQLWRLVLGMVLIVVTWALVTTGLLAAAWLTAPDRGMAFAETLLAARTPLSTLLMLGGFAGMAAGAMIAARFLHARSPATLFGPRVRVLRDFVTAALTVSLVLAISVAGWSFFYAPLPGRPFASWLAILPVALLAILVQTCAEELVFRAYLPQQLAARFKTPLVWAVIPALLFGVSHFSPSTSGANAWLVVGTTATFGLIAIDLTARTGSIGASWGFHFANNTFALLVVATEGPLDGLALLKTPYSAEDAEKLAYLLPVDVFFMLVSWLILRRIFATR